MFKRKTPAERETQRVEAAEQVRRARSGDFDSLRNPNVVLPDPEVVAAVSAYDRALRELERTGSLPAATGVEAPVCSKHDWRPKLRPGQPRPPVHMCPECLGASDYRRPDVSEAQASIRPVEVPDPAYGPPAPPNLERAWQEHLASLEEAGEVIPGSMREEAVIEYMNNKRAAVLAEEARRSRRGKPAYVNPITGQTFYAQSPMRLRRRRSARQLSEHIDIEVEA